MAKLQNLKVNARLMREGDWVELEDFDGMRLHVRAQGRAYFDAKAIAENRAAQRHGGDILKVPEAELDAIVAEVVGDKLLINVEQLEDDDGPVTLARYRELMRDPENQLLVSAVIVASERLARRARNEARDAKGNSSPPSAGG